MLRTIFLTALAFTAYALPNPAANPSYAKLLSRALEPNATYETLTHNDFPNHRLRLRQLDPSALCGDRAKHYSGFLDITPDGDVFDGHLFFIFYEARSNPDSAPLALWTNGGPGASSTDGFFNENGACRMTDDGLSSYYNNHAFNEAANFIWLDQPVGVGYSFGNKVVAGSETMAEDVYAFLQLWFKKFPHFKGRDFHLTGESYSGVYSPHTAHSIVSHNDNLLPSQVAINLKSLLIGNGIYNWETQLTARYDYTCNSSYAYLDSDTCDGYARNLTLGLDSCRATCAACNEAIDGNFGLISQTASCFACSESCPQPIGDRNPYDKRIHCPPDRMANGDYCYPFWNNIGSFANQHSVQDSLNVPSGVKFQDTSAKVNILFTLSGDKAKGSYRLIPDLVARGIRFGSYVGDQDSICDWIGNLRWMSELNWPHAGIFSTAPMIDGNLAGNPHSVKKIGNGAGDFTFVRVADSGHLVPHDQPAYALELVKRWFANVDLV